MFGHYTNSVNRYRLSNTHRAEGALAGFPLMMAA
jgi:hypothetical protein